MVNFELIVSPSFFQSPSLTNLIMSLASWMLGFINLQISQSSVIIPNILYGFGMAMGMMPIVTLSCMSISKDKMANASGLQNFIKTVGGAVGTSLVATFISRFSQVHQNMLIHNLTETNTVFVERLNAMASSFMTMTDPMTAKTMAGALINGQLIQQAHLWAFIDAFRLYAITGFLVIILVLLMKKKKDAFK